MNYNSNYSLDDFYIPQNTPIWNKNFLESMIAFLKKYKSVNDEIANKRPFTEFLLEIEEAYRLFLNKINDLPTIMKCRVKGDDNAHFGGQECADFAKSLRISAEKYLKSTNLKKDNTNKSYDFALKIRDKARTDEQTAKNIEYEVYNEYLSLGKDRTLDALKKEGYLFQNN